MIGSSPEGTDGLSTRSRLIDGAARAVTRYPLRELTVEHVIRAAGLSRRTFYLYFQGKEGILQALYERVVTELIERISQAVASAGDPVRRLDAGIDAYLAFQQDGGRLVASLQAEAVDPTSGLWPIRERTLDALGGIIDREARAGLGVEVHPLVYRMLLMGLEELVLHLRQGGPFAPDSRVLAARIFRSTLLATLLGAEHLPAPDADGREP